MKFPHPLVPARLTRRYKRFLADAVLADGTDCTVHCPNPGAMLGLARPGAEIWLHPALPGRKLAWSWELERVDGHLVGINTNRPNGLAAEAISAGRVPGLEGYAALRREVAAGRSRFDLRLDGPGRPPCWVEVKNVHLRRGTRAEFPDCVTLRGARHLDDLAARVAAGERAVMLYVVQRGDCDRFGIAGDLDPGYAQALARARAAGVEVLCHVADVALDGLRLDGPLPLDLAEPGGTNHIEDGRERDWA